MSEEPTLNELLEKARHHVMTDEEKQAQRESWVRGEQALGEMDDAMTSPFMSAAASQSGEGEQAGLIQQRARCRDWLERCGYRHLITDPVVEACAAYTAASQPPVAQNDVTLERQVEIFYARYMNEHESEVMTMEPWQEPDFNKRLIVIFARDYARQSQERVAELERERDAEHDRAERSNEVVLRETRRAETAELAINEAAAKAWEEASHYVDFATAEKFCARAQEIREGK